MTLILNTWIFENDVKKGVSQVDLVKRVATWVQMASKFVANTSKTLMLN